MRHVPLVLWMLSLLMEGVSCGFCVRQLRHPFAFPRWWLAWSCALGTHLIIVYRRLRLLAATVGSQGAVPLAFGDLTEQWLPFVVSLLLLLFNWWLAAIFVWVLGPPSAPSPTQDERG